MPTITVYRVEAVRGPKAGQGPYSAHPFFDTPERDARNAAMARIDSWDEEHPEPEEDPGLQRMIDESEYCGFTSKRALRRWFRNGSLRLLCKSGFYAVVAYEVPREAVARGHYQVLFTRDQHVARRVLDLNSL